MAGPAGVPGFYDPRRAQNPGLGKATLNAGPIVPLTVKLPPGSSLVTKNSDLNKNYSDAQARLTAAQASGDPVAINKAQTNLYFHTTQLNNFVKGQNDTTRSTLDEKNIVDPNKPVTPTTMPKTEANRDDRPAPANSTVQTAQVSPITLKPNENLLHGYSSYTYKFSLGILGEDDYNNLVNDPKRVVDLKNILIASGGISQDKRAAYFKNDFYFDSIEMEATFGSGAEARNTNVQQFIIKIIEPYSVTLIERLVKVATESVKSNSYIEQPYVLTLDFWGYNDEALSPIKIEGCSRNFIIAIKNITFNLTHKGAEYELTCSPFAHGAFNESVATISSNFEVSAKTVKEFFGDGTDAAQAAIKVASAGRDDRAGSPPTPELLTGSLGYVLTQHSKKLQEKGEIEIADEFKFVIDKEIANAAILSSDDTSIKDVPMKTEAFKKYAAAKSIKNISYDNEKRKISVAAGTTLINLINDIVLHSTYSLDQVIDATDEEAKTLKETKPIQWVRIVPDIELLGFDKKRNTYAKRFTYNVLKFSVFGHNHEQMGQAPVPGVAKIYDYFYTGQNKDIIDLKLEFKSAITLYTNSNRSIKAGSTPPKNIDNNPDKTDISNPPADAFPTKVAVSNSPALNSAARASTNSNDLILNDVSNSLITGYQSDLVHLDISIVGDPAYITQTDVFYGKFTGNFAGSTVLPDGSLNPCITDIFALIRFNTPNDIDVDKGMYDFTDKGNNDVTSSSFTGLYRVTKLTNHFSGGKFTQNLTMVRMPAQSTNYIIESAAKNKFVNTDSSPDAIKKLESQASKVLTGIANELSDLASIFAPIKNLLNGRL